MSMPAAPERLVILPYEPVVRTGLGLLSVLVAAVASLGVVQMLIALDDARSLREWLNSATTRTSLAFLAASGATIAVAMRLNRRRLERVLAMIGTRPPAEVLAAALEAPQWLGDPADAVRQAASELRGRGLVCGEAFAALHPPEAAAIQPIEAGFEPVPLDETDARFEELRAAHETDEPRRCETFQRRRTRRWITRMLPIAAVLPGVTILAAAGAWRFVGVLTGVLMVVAATILTLAQLRSARGAAGGGWHLVPASVLVLRPMGRRWRPVLLTARNAILIAWPETPARLRWRIAVSSPRRWFTRRVTPMELRMLLAAWLSPLKPPSAEQLSDLSGYGERMK